MCCCVRACCVRVHVHERVAPSFQRALRQRTPSTRALATLGAGSTGNVDVMRSALEAAHRGWGVSCVIGVAAAGKEISTRPFQLVTGRKWVGTAFGGFKSRDDVPALVSEHLDGELALDHFVSKRFSGIDGIQEAIDSMHSGQVLRAVVSY